MTKDEILRQIALEAALRLNPDRDGLKTVLT